MKKKLGGPGLGDVIIFFGLISSILILGPWVVAGIAKYTEWIMFLVSK